MCPLDRGLPTGIDRVYISMLHQKAIWSWGKELMMTDGNTINQAFETFGGGQ